MLHIYQEMVHIYGGYFEISYFIKLFRYKVIIFRDNNFNNPIFNEGDYENMGLLQYVHSNNSNFAHFNAFGNELTNHNTAVDNIAPEEIKTRIEEVDECLGLESLCSIYPKNLF